MKVTVRLFAVLRERAGASSLELELEDGTTVEQALEVLRTGPLSGDVPFLMAVNREYAAGDTTLRPGDEIALVPPVSGGAPEGDRVRRVQITEEPLDPGALAQLVGDPRAGAVVTFQGTTRDVPRLRYEAYTEMALSQMREIAQAAVARHGLLAAAVEHRIGAVPLGEASVIVAASAAHREAAFAGARELIDEIKARAPIWKREEDDHGGGAWVEGTLPEV